MDISRGDVQVALDTHDAVGMPCGALNAASLVVVAGSAVNFDDAATRLELNSLARAWNRSLNRRRDALRKLTVIGGGLCDAQFVDDGHAGDGPRRELRGLLLRLVAACEAAQDQTSVDDFDVEIRDLRWFEGARGLLRRRSNAECLHQGLLLTLRRACRRRRLFHPLSGPMGPLAYCVPNTGLRRCLRRYGRMRAPWQRD